MRPLRAPVCQWSPLPFVGMLCVRPGSSTRAPLGQKLNGCLGVEKRPSEVRPSMVEPSSRVAEQRSFSYGVANGHHFGFILE
jgi:hypothetical protein